MTIGIGNTDEKIFTTIVLLIHTKIIFDKLAISLHFDSFTFILHKAIDGVMNLLPVFFLSVLIFKRNIYVTRFT